HAQLSLVGARIAPSSRGRGQSSMTSLGNKAEGNNLAELERWIVSRKLKKNPLLFRQQRRSTHVGLARKGEKLCEKSS
ncbi:MAG: hypothetical protein WBE02_07425, partial [Bradyrhizobium sp.]